VRRVLPVLALAAALAGAAAAAPAGEPPAAAAQEIDDLFHLSQDYLKNLGPYKPLYFLFGIPLEDSKFQVSFKYRFFNAAAPLVEKHPWVSGFHFGYTQTSFWDLGSDSLPFQDTSYMPELFYLSRNSAWRPFGADALFWQGGLHHESNGKSGAESRSTNTLYLTPVLVYYRPESGRGLALIPRVQYYFDNSESSNPDIEDYRGYVELDVLFGQSRGLIVRTNLRAASEGPSFQVGATYPLSRSWFQNAQLYVMAEYTNALGESILHYRERNEAVRVGIAFYR
jgi:outer membrane phospholipase A